MSSVDLLQVRPESIAIEVTSQCNLRCCYCVKADGLHEALPGANTDMSDAMISELYHYCKRAGIKKVCLSGVGETTMHKGWPRRIKQFLDDPEITTHLNSNFARVFDDDDLAALLRLDSLQISFDSPDLATLRKLRSRVDVRTITYNIVRLQEMARRVGHRPHIRVNCVLSRINIGQLVDMAALCRGLAVDLLMLSEIGSGWYSKDQPVGVHNPNMPPMLDALTEDEVVLLAEQIIGVEDMLAGSATGLWVDGRMAPRLQPVLTGLRQGAVPPDAPANFYKRPATVSSCRMPWTSPVVLANGDVVPCCETTRAGPVVGNIGQKSLEEIFRAAPYRAVLNSLIEGRPLLACHGCSCAEPVDFPEFARGIEEWQIGAAASD